MPCPPPWPALWDPPRSRPSRWTLRPGCGPENRLSTVHRCGGSIGTRRGVASPESRTPSCERCGAADSVLSVSLCGPSSTSGGLGRFATLPTDVLTLVADALGLVGLG